METDIIPDYNRMGGSGSPWINPPIAPPARTGMTPSEQRRVQNGVMLSKPWGVINNNLRGSGGGVNSPRNDRKKDAKTAMSIGALDLKREQDHVHENSSYPP